MSRTRIVLAATILVAALGVAVMLLKIIPASAGVAQAIPPVDPVAVRAAATAAGLSSLANTGVPQVNNMGDFINPDPGAKGLAVVMGKALFWDMQVGSDGQACASCHFAAGADNRTKNQVNPGLRAVLPDTTFGNSAVTGAGGFPQFGPNYTNIASDYPTHVIADPTVEDYNHRVVARDVNDVTSSQGVFKGTFTGVVPGQLKDAGTAVADPLFNVGGVNVRRVPPRNAPTVINAVFNIDNFWDGRARSRFNGIDPLGPLNSNATILVNAGSVLSPTQVSIVNSSLASQAVGPPLSDLEMTFTGRTFPDIGKKMLAARPLAFQAVHVNDSVLGHLSRASQAPPANGLTFATYADLVRAIFQPKYYDSTNVITFDASGNRTINPPGTPNGYTQMEANFSLFFGLAVQAYESTLVSDRTRFDLFMEGDDTALDQDELRGLLTFINRGTLAQLANPVFAGISVGNCTGCHGGPLFSDATIPVAAAAPIEIEFAPTIVNGLVVNGTQLVLLDNGFYNIGVRPINEDLGRGGTELGKPLSSARQALAGLPFAPPIPAGAPVNPVVQADGAFKVPGLRNVELTAPYFHDGNQRTLREVISFYRRHGDFADVNIGQLDGPLAEVVLRSPDVLGTDVDADRLIKFMLALTDYRVRNEMGPFDHPQISLPNGHPGDRNSIPPSGFTVVNGVNQANDVLLNLPAVGRNGRQAEGLPLLKGFLDTGALQFLNINLHPGWNAFSTPVNLSSTTNTWGAFSAANGLSYQIAYRWTGTAFAALAPTDVLSPLDAIYVLMNAPAKVEIVPQDSVSAPVSKALTSGWNFVGSAFLTTEMPVTDALTSVFFVPNSVPTAAPLWGYVQVVSPNTNLFNWSFVRGALTVPNMRVGEGYWVSMVNPGQLSGFTSTPSQPMQAPSTGLGTLTPSIAPTQIPSLPQYLYGAVRINGSLAPVGTTVEARATGAVTNAIVTTQIGKQGDASPTAVVPRLLVQGSIVEGTTIEFFINGFRADQTAVFRAGQIQLLDLSTSTLGVDVQGTLIFQGGGRPKPAGWQRPLTVMLFTPGSDVLNSAPLATHNMMTGFDAVNNLATFTLFGVTPGTYDIAAVSPSSLVNVRRNVTVSATQNTPSMGTLLAGNAVDWQNTVKAMPQGQRSDKVDISDFGKLGVCFLKQVSSPALPAPGTVMSDGFLTSALPPLPTSFADADSTRCWWADFDGSGAVNIGDFGLIAANFLKLSPVAQ